MDKNDELIKVKSLLFSAVQLLNQGADISKSFTGTILEGLNYDIIFEAESLNHMLNKLEGVVLN